MRSRALRVPRTAGTYRRGFPDGQGQVLATPHALAVAKLLQFAGLTYRYEEVTVARQRVPVLATARGTIVVLPAHAFTGAELAQLGQALPAPPTLVVSALQGAPSAELLGAPVVHWGGAWAGVQRRTAIFLDDPGFAFDYSHILPASAQCSVLHGHTSSVLVEVVGPLAGGMVVDFGVVKQQVRTALRRLDHKLFIRRQYVTDAAEGQYRIQFTGPHGAFDLRVPQASTYLLEGEATTEHLAAEVLRLLAPAFPREVEAVGVYVYEGLNKGAHLLARALTRA